MPAGVDVEIEVAGADALAFEADVLVLKHAQESLGVDAEAKRRLGLDLDIRLRPGEVLKVEDQVAVTPANVIFLGVPSLQRFGYAEIRLFGRRAFGLVGEELPEARHMAITLHGVGFGLDETACLEEEVSGLIEGAADATAGAIERVTIVERDPRRAERLQAKLAEILARELALEADTSPGDLPISREEGAPSDLALPPSNATKAHAFVAMPFSPDSEDRFHYGISQPIRGRGLLVERLDQAIFTGSIIDRMKEKIRTATIVVADLTGANPNVYLEVGYAWAAGVQTVLVYDRDAELKFDVQSERCIGFASIKDLEARLRETLAELVP